MGLVSPPHRLTTTPTLNPKPQTQIRFGGGGGGGADCLEKGSGTLFVFLKSQVMGISVVSVTGYQRKTRIYIWAPNAKP